MKVRRGLIRATFDFMYLDELLIKHCFGFEIGCLVTNQRKILHHTN